MKNPPMVQVSPEKVAAIMDQVASGNKMLGGLQDVAHATHHLTDAAGSAAGALAAPGGGLARGVLDAASSVGNAVVGSRIGRASLLGGLVAAPILGKAYQHSIPQKEEELMQMRRNPERTVTAADLDLFLEKIAIIQSGVPPASPMDGHIGKFTDGFGGGVGKGFGDTLANSVMNGVSALTDYLVNDRKRRAMLESLMRSDHVLADAVKHDPKASQHIAEAFQTLVRFAPSLAMDPNATRSFLRESVLSGGGINFATIKNLADTEKSIAGRNGR